VQKKEKKKKLIKFRKERFWDSNSIYRVAGIVSGKVCNLSEIAMAVGTGSFEILRENVFKIIRKRNGPDRTGSRVMGYSGLNCSLII